MGSIEKNLKNQLKEYFLLKITDITYPTTNKLLLKLSENN